MSPTILTASGRYFDILAPTFEETYAIDEIAHALSHICRFTGHTRTFYSVAQHCYHASFLVPKEHALAALMHDAAEAYLGDVSSPLKQLLPDYRAIEEQVEQGVFSHFGIATPLHPCVKHADLVMLATEQRDLMPGHAHDWMCLRGIAPMPTLIAPMSPEEARQKFLHRVQQLTSGDAH